MATERVYSPEDSEPFDVSPSRARDLVLNKGWTKTPWTREPVEAPVAEEAPRGRGRRRRVAEEAPIEHIGGPAPFVLEDEAPEDAEAESWRI